MKRNILLLSLIITILVSCSKDFLSVNETNPNSPSSVPPGLLLTSALNSTVRNINMNLDLTDPINPVRRGFDFVYLWYGQWSISQGYSQPTNLTQYNLFNRNYQDNWRENYLTAGNFDYIEKASQNANSQNYLAIAKIMKAFIFHIMVDCYGNIPYTDAFKASDSNFKPNYDKDQLIYEDLIKQLDDAKILIANASLTAENPSKYDVMFNGDMNKWIKFANTLKLRILMHQTAMSGRIDSYIKPSISTIKTEQFIGVGESAMVKPGYSKSEGKQNPFWEVFFKSDDTKQADAATYYFAGSDAVDFYTGTNDPRGLKFFAPYKGTSIGGNYFGAKLLKNATETSPIGEGLLKAFDQQGIILTDFESLFLQAEAAYYGIITGDAKALYESAVKQSFVYLGLSLGQASEYLGQQNIEVNYDLAPNKQQLILTQKWAALNGITPYEIWTDYRRTGFPNFIHFTEDGNKKNPTPPVRLLYPQTELQYNSAAVLAQGTINVFTSKIFWQSN